MKYKNDEGIVLRFYRIERWFYLHGIRIVAKFVYHLIQLLFGCTIPYSTDIGKGCKIAHYHGIVLHQNCVVGEGTIIYQNVCLGGRNGKGGPCIGNNCIIGAGACVLGEIKIGNNVKIGANSVVIEDIPDNCTVVGVPSEIVKWSEVK